MDGIKGRGEMRRRTRKESGDPLGSGKERWRDEKAGYKRQ